MDVRETRLSNGIRIVTSSIPHVESVSFGIWVGVGSRYELKKNAGVSHFIEHLFFKGTKKRSAKSISQAIEGRGGYLNAFTQEESTCYYARVAYDKIWNAVDVLADMYLNSRFDNIEIEKERRVIMEEIMMYRDQPDHMVHEMLSSLLWEDHPLGIPVIGFSDTLKKMTREDILRFKKKKYVAANTLFAFAGKIDHDVCVHRIISIFGEFKRGNMPSYKPLTSMIKQKKLDFCSKDIEQSHLAIGIRLFGRRDRRRYALRVLNAVLGENMSSRLFQIIRERHGLAYSVHSSPHLFNDSGALVISAGLDRKKTVKATDLIFKELTKLREQPVGRGELKRAKDYVIGHLRLGLESTTHQMMWIGDNIISYGKFVPPEDVIAEMSNITASDIQNLSKSIFKKSRISMALVHPEMSKLETARIKSAAMNL